MEAKMYTLYFYSSDNSLQLQQDLPFMSVPELNKYLVRVFSSFKNYCHAKVVDYQGKETNYRGYN